MLRILMAAGLFLGLLMLPVSAQTNCALPQGLLPSGPLGTPGEQPPFDVAGEYGFMHSGLHLMGNPTTKKFAPGLFWEPNGGLFPELAGFRSGIVINNVDGVQTLKVTIHWFAADGTSIVSVNRSIPPNESRYLQATPLQAFGGVGSATIESETDLPFVAGSFHHTYRVYDNMAELICEDPIQGKPGAVTLQPMQEVVQGNGYPSQLFWGPLVASTVEQEDFLNRQLPFFFVRNPHNFDIKVKITITSANLNLGSTTHTIQANGTHLHMRLYRLLESTYNSGAILDEDFIVAVNEEKEGHAIIGDGVMVDYWGSSDENPSDAVVCNKLRMSSTMLFNKTNSSLVNPEFVREATSPGVTTTMGLFNAATTADNVTVRYYDNLANVVGTSTLTIPPFTAARITKNTAGYPGSLIEGWAWITSCEGQIFGWSMREVDEIYKKAWGEGLSGNNINEPGPGYYTQPDVNNDQAIWRKSGLITANGAWPGTTHLVNFFSSNIQNYWFRFYRFTTPNLDATNYASQPFAGLPWGHTAFTFESQFTTNSATEAMTGRVDRVDGQIEGIHTWGDPIRELTLLNWPDPTVPDGQNDPDGTEPPVGIEP